MVWVIPLLAMKLIPYCLTPEEHMTGIRSLFGFGTVGTARTHLVLYLQHTFIQGYP